ncbi:unnamed protein product [Haemonchus placei]|uniref:Peptidase A2 domain-containing protein n=1 Tax=Haemonchus placei TaxID=6290 RepID=A0A0N4X3L0_HAEPC|nr:unnamed protein product [Haemonchus placei]
MKMINDVLDETRRQPIKELQRRQRERSVQQQSGRRGDTVATLKELFGHNTSVSSRRYVYLKTQRYGEYLRDYTGFVNQRHAMAEFNDFNPEQMKCLVWICGLASHKDAYILARAKMEDNPQTTLKELAAKIQQFLNIRQDATLPRGLLRYTSTPLTLIAEYTTHHHHVFAVERIIGQGRGFCKNFTTKRKQKPKRKRKTTNNVVVASTHAGNTSISRIYLPVQINCKTICLQLDAGADVTLLSSADWIAMSRPTLRPPKITLRSANDEPINVRGCYECTFVIDGHHGRGMCYVTDTVFIRSRLDHPVRPSVSSPNRRLYL